MSVTHHDTFAFQAFQQALSKKFPSNWRSHHSLFCKPRKRYEQTPAAQAKHINHLHNELSENDINAWALNIT